MTLSEICVRRPVFATMLTTACVAVGALSFGDLGIDQFPDVELPVVNVSTSLPGASPEEIETQVTEVIEDAVSQIEGIDELRSTSEEGMSNVSVSFVLDRDRDEATQDVRDKVAAVLRRLPDGTQPPSITRFDTTAAPVLTLVVSGRGTLRETTEIARKTVQEPLQSVSGVAQVRMSGGRTRAFNVLVDADAMTRLGVTTSQIRAAIAQQNVEVPGGRISEGAREEGVRVVGRFASARELAGLVVVENPGAPILLSDLARIEDSEEEPRSLSTLDGKAAVSLVIQKQAGTNTVAVVDDIFARLDTIRETLPPGIEIDVIRDQSRFIRASIHEVEVHLVLGALLASLAVLFFMGSLRSTFIAAISIPASIITTFAILRALDYTLNNFTLLALTMSVGVVIDDAIVVLENIFRHVEEGENPFRAALTGTKEITLAVFATTLSLIIIFVPTAFMEGRVGRFWQSFGVTTAFAIAISLFIALTLTPMLSSKLLRALRHREKRNWLERGVRRFNDVLDNGYAKLVSLSLRVRWLVAIIAVGTIASVVPLIGKVGKDFLPLDDTSDFQITLTMPEGSTLQESARISQEIEGKIKTLRGVERIFTNVGSGDDVTYVQMYAQVVDISKREYSVFDVMGEARTLLRNYADLRPAVSGTGGFGGSRQLSFSLQGADLATLDALSAQVVQKLQEKRGFVDVDSSAAVRRPEVRVKIDRARAADLHVRAADIASTLRTLVGGEIVSKMRDGDEQYDVWLRLEPEDRNSAESLALIPIASGQGMQRLDAVATFERERGPAEITRLDRIRQVELGANLDGLPLGEALEIVKKTTDELGLPSGYRVVFSGRAKIMGETISSFLTALGLSFLFMYMVLAAQFESFLHPVTIMLALPLSLPFAIISLMLLGDTLNIYSAFGTFMLFGIVKKNGILQVDYTNTLRSRGIERNQAIIEANKTRLRPILMTTLTLIAGMMPIALGEGPGSATRASMARVIIGGQALSLLITLLIVPVAYSYFDDISGTFARVRKRFAKKDEDPAANMSEPPAGASVEPAEE